MSTTVTEFPKIVRKTKYDYDTLFNGDIHRLVQGEDFPVSQASFRTALYTRVKTLNKSSDLKIALKTRFAVEDGNKVVFVQRIAAKPAKAKAKAKPAAKKKAPARKPAAKKA